MIQQILDLFKFLEPVLFFAWQIFKAWWWLPLPFILWKPAKFFWRWWRIDTWLAKQKMILLEIKMPKDVVKPIRSMETVMDSLHKIIFKPPDWWETWVDGEIQLSYAFEMISISGETHFYVRLPSSFRNAVEAAFYAQYPDAEISEAEDYTKNVPQDIPNKEWDIWAADYALMKENPYPIKTYTKFETEREALEEKRIDPISNLLEAMAKIKQGEQLWIQILAEPVTDKESPHWITQGKELKDDLARRPKKVKPRPIALEAADVLVTGEVPGEKKKEESVFPPEMKLTPGERDIISEVEQKISKPGFKSSARFIYMGKKDVFFKPNMRLGFSYFGAYTTENLNGFKPYGQPFITKIKKSWFLPKNIFIPRKLYLRKRKIFRWYKQRFDPFFPAAGRWPGVFILNTEELASLFHFPSRRVAQAPYVRRVESKKGEAPPDLPTE
jgi:hypothetical protein